MSLATRCPRPRSGERRHHPAARSRVRRPRRQEVQVVLSIDSLHVSYGGVQAVRGISMEIPDGKVVAVLGSNGAGKTTLLRAISGTLKLHRGRVESGSVSFDGAELTG